MRVFVNAGEAMGGLCDVEVGKKKEKKKKKVVSCSWVKGGLNAGSLLPTQNHRISCDPAAPATHARERNIALSA